MTGIIHLLLKWWALCALVVSCAAAVALLSSRLFAAFRENRNQNNERNSP